MKTSAACLILCLVACAAPPTTNTDDAEDDFQIASDAEELKAGKGPLVPVFSNIPSTWLQPLTFDMTGFWAAAGLPERGTNYYSAGAPSDANTPYWERFNPNSRYYQAWFGAYIVESFEFADEWKKAPRDPELFPQTVERVLALIRVDQNAWLAAFGDPSQPTELLGDSVQVKVAARGWLSIDADFKSHSDLGGTIPQIPFYTPYASFERLVPAYQDVELTTHTLVKYFADTKQLVILYASGADRVLTDGTVLATPAIVLREQKRMAKGFTLKRSD